MTTIGGRKSGGHNRGYWYRSGRGWYASENRRNVPLRDSKGQHIKDRAAAGEAKRAYETFCKERDKRRARNVETVLMASMANHYLSRMKEKCRDSTYRLRARFLFDFCTGFPARFADSRQRPTAKDRIHRGYGDLELRDLTPAVIHTWLSRHPTWKKGTWPVAIISIKAAVHRWIADFAPDEPNPLRHLPNGDVHRRATYLTPELETAIYQNATARFRLVIKVLIRTGVRPSELCNLRRRHVVESEQGQKWVLKASESKTNRTRTIFVPDEIARVVRMRLRMSTRDEPVFQSATGTALRPGSLSMRFRRLLNKLAVAGFTISEDDCLYSCRHTFAKRTLGGYWTGTPVTLEVLAGLMGNSPTTCWKYYAHWVSGYEDPLWAAVKSRAPMARKDKSIGPTT